MEQVLENFLRDPSSERPEDVLETLEEWTSRVFRVVSKFPWLRARLSFAIRKRHTGEKRRRSRLQSIFKADARDSEEQHELYESFRKDPNAFWTFESPTAHLNELQTSLLDDPVYNGLHTCFKLEQAYTHQVLRYRLNCIIICVISRSFPERYQIHLIIQNLNDAGLLDGSEAASKSIEGILRRGERLVHVAQNLGIGSIWCIATAIAHTA